MARSAPGVADAIWAARGAWRSLKRVDFAQALAAPVLAKTPHFVLHHVAASPPSSVRRTAESLAPELSTGTAPNRSTDVDNNRTPRHWWLGLVVPKRHARRSVTRSLLKRQMRAQADGHRHALPPGQWLIRLRAPFDPRHYPSAASSQLREAAREELERAFASVVTA
jgi:ribonuclease P protein component